MKYNIFIYCYLGFRTFFSRIQIFPDRIRIFGRSWIRIFGRSGSGIREKKPDPKHWYPFFQTIYSWPVPGPAGGQGAAQVRLPVPLPGAHLPRCPSHQDRGPDCDDHGAGALSPLPAAVGPAPALPPLPAAGPAPALAPLARRRVGRVQWRGGAQNLPGDNKNCHDWSLMSR